MTWVFVYAADSGPVNAALDWAHKLVSPTTYACDLCRITYGAFGRKQEWDKALERLPGTKEFYHEDEFQRAHPGKASQAPAVWRVEGDRWTLVLGLGGWDSIDSVSALEARLVQSLSVEA